MSAEPDFAWSRLEALYDSLPSVQCQGKCQMGCGPIRFSQVEGENMRRRGFALPTVTTHPTLGELTCSALERKPEGEARCTIYEARPLVCRVFGATRMMQCPHGCKPNRFFGPAEKQRVMAELQALSVAIGGDGRLIATATVRQIEDYARGQSGKLVIG